MNKDRKQGHWELGIDVIENDEFAEIVADSKINFIKYVLSKSNILYKDEVLFYHIGSMIQNEIANQLSCEFDEGYVKINKKTADYSIKCLCNR
jgi:hypothetical protein